MDRSLIRWGFVLFLASLLGGFAIPMLKNPSLGLSAHTIGVLSSLFLIAVGVIWSSLKLGPLAKRITYWLWLVSMYGNWLGTLLAAYFGGSRMAPITSGGWNSTPTRELLVSMIIIPISILSLAAVAMVLWGLRGKKDETLD